MSLMLRSGVPLDRRGLVDVSNKHARGTGTGRVAATAGCGAGKVFDLAPPGRRFRAVRLLVARGGDDLAAGFQKAAEIFSSARQIPGRDDSLLGAAGSILALGLMIIFPDANRCSSRSCGS